METQVIELIEIAQVDSQESLRSEALRELTALDLALVGGGTISAVFG